MQHPPEAKASLSPPPRLDARYGIAREFCGARKPRWVVRFCGDFVISADTKREATTHAHTYEVGRLARITGKAA